MKKNIKKPNAILFVCNINSIRSPMAEAITKEWFDRKIFVDSCGIKFGKIDYLAVEVMAEKKLNLAGHKSKLFSELDNTFFDLIITFTKEAPADGTIIKVNRLNDKYLKFRNKGIF